MLHSVEVETLLPTHVTHIWLDWIKQVNDCVNEYRYIKVRNISNIESTSSDLPVAQRP